MSYTKPPTRSVKRIMRQIDRARRDKVMVVLHPGTVEWLLAISGMLRLAREVAAVPALAPAGKGRAR